MSLAHTYTDRNAEILEEILQGQKFVDVAHKNNLSIERIRQIVQKCSGLSSKDLRSAGKEYTCALHAENKKLLDILQQYYFDRLIKEKGLDHALAWRCQKVYGWGKNYSADTLERIIALRRAGEGYNRIIRSSALISRVLTVALYGVYYKKPTLAWENKKYLLTLEEEAAFITDWKNYVSDSTLKEKYFDNSESLRYHVKRLGLEKREGVKKMGVGKTAEIRQFLLQGKTTKEIVALGYDLENICRRRYDLRKEKLLH